MEKRNVDSGLAAMTVLVQFILGMALLKTCPEQVLVIIASYPLLKKINVLACNTLVQHCCALIWEMCN